MQRRDFIKSLGLATGAALTAGGSDARAVDAVRAAEGMGILVDLTRCVGCRSCEEACASANKLPAPVADDEVAFRTPRDTTPKQWTVVQRHKRANKGAPVFVKRQCLHCVQPACVSACLTRAMHKTKQGPVIWREDKCMGCRFCMVSCPFDVPRFEYHSANPKIQKCQLCWARLNKGDKPACVEDCPEDTLTFGKRAKLLHEARHRIISEPGKYVDHIYGEHEAGGTSVLYISPVPFSQLAFRMDLDHESYPALTREFLYAVPLVLTLAPALLLGLRQATAGAGHAADDESASVEEHDD